MLTTNFPMPSIVRASGLALLAAVAIGAAQPSAAIAATAQTPSISQSVTVAPTDISAARRHRQARKTSPREAYGSYVGVVGGGATASYPGYGYGVGDNSRGQTW
jgi:hypothetical protein